MEEAIKIEVEATAQVLPKFTLREDVPELTTPSHSPYETTIQSHPRLYPLRCMLHY